MAGAVQVPNFYVQNNSGAALSLNQIYANGFPQLFGQLPPGTGTTVGPVYFGGVFTLNNANGVVSVFVASAAAGQVFVATDSMISFWK